MKVLFAVSNEEISESIVKKYQKEYKQIISYKNVYYFNAILKELQKDKSYDRVVISEELEAFAHNQYDQIDKFIFEKLDSISDEASRAGGLDTPIIVISSDRRSKSEPLLVKLFGIGIYNAIIGNDRSIDEVCRLINTPRTKKDAKLYYGIDAEDVSYKSENENDVSETEIQNIVSHYKRLGNNEERYIESFENIAAQYNDIQLRVISKFLPLHVRAVLEEKSNKYQQVMSFNTSVSNSLRNENEQKVQKTSEVLLNLKTEKKTMTRPVVIPSAINMNSSVKLARTKGTEFNPVEDKVNDILEEVVEVQDEPKSFNTQFEDQFEELEEIKPEKQVQQSNNILETVEIQEEIPVKKGRGRPRKIDNTQPQPISNEPKRGRGRPKKYPEIKEVETTENILPGFDDIEPETSNILPGFSDIEPETSNMLPGFDDIEPETSNMLPGFDDIEPETSNMLPGFSDEELEIDTRQARFEGNNNVQAPNNQNNYMNQSTEVSEKSNYVSPTHETKKEYASTIDLSELLSGNKKVASFVGTTKNGTSFVVNNVAKMLAKTGVNVAILDTTKNKNSYYVYTNNEEELRMTAIRTVENLLKGIANGIQVEKNLTVYTANPNDEDEMGNDVDKILETLLKNHTVVLIDTDYETSVGYFKNSHEIYLVQSFDVLTIQPLTEFLMELMKKNILDETKLRIILNKTVKIRGIDDKTIIGGMSSYKDATMSNMVALFDRNKIRYVPIAFEEKVYTKYLESVIMCDINLNGYSKTFMQSLTQISSMVYQTNTNKNGKYMPPSVAQNQANNNFSPTMNNTLEQMKKRY